MNQIHHNIGIAQNNYKKWQSRDNAYALADSYRDACKHYAQVNKTLFTRYMNLCNKWLAIGNSK